MYTKKEICTHKTITKKQQGKIRISYDQGMYYEQFYDDDKVRRWPGLGLDEYIFFEKILKLLF